MTTTSSDINDEEKPRSIRVQPWSEFPKQSYSIHKDKFCHENPLVVNFQARGRKSAFILKQTVTRKERRWNVQDDLKLWFQLENSHSLYARVKSTDYIKLHYDHGLNKWRDQQWNFYSSFWTDKSLSKSSVRLGVQSIHPRCWSDNRLRINSATEQHNIHFYNRTLAFWNQTKFGLLAVVDLTKQVLQKNNILLGHIFKDRHQVFFRLENNGFRLVNPHLEDIRSIWDTVTANYVGRLDQSTKAGVEVQFCLRNNQLKKIQGVVEKFLPQQGIILKAKLNNHHDTAFLIKRALWGNENLLNFSLGLGVKNALSQKRSQHFGVQIDINI